MPPRKPKLHTSDRDILRARPSRTADVEIDDEHPAGPDLGDSEDSIIAAMNAVFRDLSTGRIQKDSADPMISAARVTLNAVKSRDAKQKIALLEKMLKEARDVANAGLAHEAADRHHVNKGGAPKPDGEGGQSA